MSVAKTYQEHILLKTCREHIRLKTWEDSLEDLLEIPLEAK